MAHIVILGAGIGGLPCAYELRDALGKEHVITVVNATDYFQFVPSNPWLAVGWRRRSQITLPLAPLLARRGIGFIAKLVARVEPTAKRIVFVDGQSLDYDYLVIATGAKLAFEEIQGSGPERGYTQSVCTVDHAEQAYADFERLVADPGPVVVGAVQFASCFGPAYEYAAILDTALRRLRVRHRVPMTFVTSEPYIGHLGLGGVGDSKGLLEHEFRNRHIKWITNAKVTKVEPGKLYVEEHNDQGAVICQHELGFRHAMLIPAFKGVDAIAHTEGLTNPRGFVIVDEHQKSPKYPNIYAAGVCIAIPPVETTPVPTGAPKTGYMIETMVTAIVRNIQAELAGSPAKAKGTWNAFCLADLGDTGAVFIAQPQIPPRNVTWFKQGKWVHWAKIGFEKYFLYKMRRGISEPSFERWALRLMGMARLYT